MNKKTLIILNGFLKTTNSKQNLFQKKVNVSNIYWKEITSGPELGINAIFEE